MDGVPISSSSWIGIYIRISSFLLFSPFFSVFSVFSRLLQYYPSVWSIKLFLFIDTLDNG